MRVGWIWLWVLGTLLGVGCQPYLDHEVTLAGAAPEAGRLGPRRQLQLVEMRGDEQSLLFLFNQPLRLPGSVEREPPFRPRLYPPVEFSSVEYDGVAGVRVRFAAALTFATRYQVEIPAGWRSLTGMPFLSASRQDWSTPRPELLSVTSAHSPQGSKGASLEVPLGEPLKLTFNQPVVPGSLSSLLIWEPLDREAASGSPRLEGVPEEAKGQQRTFLLWPGRKDDGTYRLALEPGLKGVQGALRGAGARELLVEVGERPLAYLGPFYPGLEDKDSSLTLRFSSPVSPAELRRCLVCLPRGVPFPSIETGEGGLKLRFPGPLPEKLVLTPGMRADDGARFAGELALTLADGSPRALPAEAAVLRGVSRFFAPGATVRLGAFFTEPPEWSHGEAKEWRVCRDDGTVLFRRTVDPGQTSVALLDFPAPDGAGDYRVELFQEQDLLASFPFTVGTTARDGESYSLELSQKDSGYSAILSRDGGRHRKVGLRALLVSYDPPRPPGWWCASGFLPTWKGLRSSSDATLEVAPEELAGGGLLTVEAFDRERPELILARQTVTVLPTAARLELQSDATAPSGVRPVLLGAVGSAAVPSAELSHRLSPFGPRTTLSARVRLEDGQELSARWELGSAEDEGEPSPRLSVDRLDGKQGALSAGEAGRWSVAWETGPQAASGPALSVCGPELPGWPEGGGWSGRPGPPGEPLLPLGWPNWGESQEMELTSPLDEQVRSLPPQAGPGRWEMVGRGVDGSVWQAQLRLQVAAVASWAGFAPTGVRSGDSYRAGVVFRAAPGASGTEGLTAQAVGGPGWLSPVGFLQTSGVLKGEGSASLGFSYRTDPTAVPPLKLAWETASGGERHRLEKDVAVWTAEPLSQGAGRATLGPGEVRRLRLEGARPWRLELVSPQGKGVSATVSVDGPDGSLGKVHLSGGSPTVVLQGRGPGTVTLSHDKGASCAFEIFRLEPDEGAVRPWGEQFYLFRELLDAQGRPTDRLSRATPGTCRLTLLAPDDLSEAILRVPLPGGVQALWVEPLIAQRPETPRVAWRVADGELRFSLHELPAGEYVWEIGLKPETDGDFLWPTARGYGDDALQALSGSSRLQVGR